MVHNGIEYGIMQALGEGFDVLQKAPYKLDVLKVARLYQKGTLVSGFMLDRAVEVFVENPTLSNVKGIIAESGEAQWMVRQAQEEGIEADIIRRSLEYRKRSQTDEKVQESFTAKLVAALRNAFGGHEIQSS
jgi:6-phosphogluconate dehydrogenase